MNVLQLDSARRKCGRYRELPPGICEQIELRQQHAVDQSDDAVARANDFAGDIGLIDLGAAATASENRLALHRGYLRFTAECQGSRIKYADEKRTITDGSAVA